MKLNKRNQRLLRRYEELMLKAISENAEVGHIACDDLLCALLNDLGFAPIVEMYRRQIKWYT